MRRSTVRYPPDSEFPFEAMCSAYTGYIDVEARHLWFWLTESDNDPSRDPVVFWTNGGPGK
jgi:carboxypeptidase C (cathepsin A)